MEVGDQSRTAALASSRKSPTDLPDTFRKRAVSMIVSVDAAYSSIRGLRIGPRRRGEWQIISSGGTIDPGLKSSDGR
jgi:hypothetical protein